MDDVQICRVCARGKIDDAQLARGMKGITLSDATLTAQAGIFVRDRTSTPISKLEHQLTWNPVDCQQHRVALFSSPKGKVNFDLPGFDTPSYNSAEDHYRAAGEAPDYNVAVIGRADSESDDVEAEAQFCERAEVAAVCVLVERQSCSSNCSWAKHASQVQHLQHQCVRNRRGLSARDRKENTLLCTR